MRTVSATGEPAALLATGPFARLPADLAQRLAHLGVVERVPASQVVFRERDPADRFYVLLAGRLRVVSSPGNDDAPVELRSLGTGAVFGELALLDGGRRSATILVKLAASDINAETYHLSNYVGTPPPAEALLILAFTQSIAALVARARRRAQQPTPA